MARVSEYRTYLMGITILWIILFHTSWYLWFPKIIELFQRSGNYGVDIFIFVSVYGLYHSMQKQLTLREWYIRRIKRIIPSFIIVVTMLGLIGRWSITDYIKEITFIGFLLPNIQYEVVFWYIPAILIFYVIFPYAYKYRKEYLIWFLIPISYVFCILFTDYIRNHDYSLFLCFFFMRIPVFLIGLLYADNEERVMAFCKKKYMLVLLGVSAVSFLLLLAACNRYLNSYLHHPSIYIIGSLPFICLISYFFQKKIKIFNPIVLFCGKYSLQIYLLHVAYINIILHVDFFQVNFNQIHLFYIAIALSFPSAFLLSKVENGIIGIIDRVR